MIALNENECRLVNDLINIAWGTGNVKAPQIAAAIESLRAKVTEQKKAE